MFFVFLLFSYLFSASPCLVSISSAINGIYKSYNSNIKEIVFAPKEDMSLYKDREKETVKKNIDRNDFRIYLDKDGLFRNIRDDNLVDNVDKPYKFIWDNTGIYIIPPRVNLRGRYVPIQYRHLNIITKFKHTDIATDFGVYSAGFIIFVNGKLSFISNYSGHYLTPISTVYDMVETLKYYGAKVSPQLKVETHDEMKDFPPQRTN